MVIFELALSVVVVLDWIILKVFQILKHRRDVIGVHQMVTGYWSQSILQILLYKPTCIY